MFDKFINVILWCFFDGFPAADVAVAVGLHHSRPDGLELAFLLSRHDAPPGRRRANGGGVEEETIDLNSAHHTPTPHQSTRSDDGDDAICPRAIPAEPRKH